MAEIIVDMLTPYDDFVGNWVQETLTLDRTAIHFCTREYAYEKYIREKAAGSKGSVILPFACYHRSIETEVDEASVDFWRSRYGAFIAGDKNSGRVDYFKTLPVLLNYTMVFFVSDIPYAGKYQQILYWELATNQEIDMDISEIVKFDASVPIDLSLMSISGTDEHFLKPQGVRWTEVQMELQFVGVFMKTDQGRLAQTYTISFHQHEEDLDGDLLFTDTYGPTDGVGA